MKPTLDDLLDDGWAIRLSRNGHSGSTVAIAELRHGGKLVMQAASEGGSIELALLGVVDKVSRFSLTTPENGG